MQLLGHHVGDMCLQVHGFRINLWREHTNAIYPSYYEPSSLQ